MTSNLQNQRRVTAQKGAIQITEPMLGSFSMPMSKFFIILNACQISLSFCVKAISQCLLNEKSIPDPS